MALQAWDKNYREQLKIQQQEIEALQQQLMIGAAKPGQSPGDDRTKEPYDKDWPPPAPLKPKLAHGEGRGPQPLYHDEYNRPLDMPPWIQMFPDGKLREIPWMKEKYLNEHPELASGPDYIGDKLRYGQLDRILNPLGDFRKPTLDQLRIHKNAYPKA